MLRLLHTSDWHLGHTLHELSREAEHQAFLDWLLDGLAEHRVDALLIAGDIFDTANPSAAATACWFRFLARARARFPRLDIVAIAGNHDSAARLDAPSPLLHELGVRIVGALPRLADGSLDLDALVFALHDAQGRVAAWCAALPFLRAADLPVLADLPPDQDPLVQGVAELYRQVVGAARDRALEDQAIVAMGHLYMVGGQLSELSERKVLGGNQHALPVQIFDPDLAYVALGHLHRAQPIGQRPEVRYSGSPIPLALDEAGYRHQVRLVELDGPRLVAQHELRVPRSVAILRLPPDGAAPWEQVAPLLAALPAARPGVDDPTTLPLLEVRVQLSEPRPGLRAEVEAALSDRAVRLVRLGVERLGSGGALADGGSTRGLGELSEEQVLREKWRRDYGSEPPDPVLACLHELLDTLRQENAA